MVEFRVEAGTGARRDKLCGERVVDRDLSARELLKFFSEIIFVLFEGRHMRCVAGITLLLASAVIAATPSTQSAKFPFTISEKTTYFTKPLLPDGRVDLAAAINERYGKNVRPEENGFAAWLKLIGPRQSDRQALSKWVGIPASAMGSELVFNGEHQEEWQFKDKDDLQESKHPHYAAYLKEKDQLLNGLAATARMKVWWIPCIQPALLLEDDYDASDICRLFYGRAMLRLGKRDDTGFVTDLETILLLAKFQNKRPGYSGLGLQYDLRCAVELAISADLLKAENLKRLVVALEDYRMPDIAADIVNLPVRIYALQIAQTLAVRKEWGDLGDQWEGVAETFEKIDRGNVDYDALFRSINATADEWTEALREKSPVEFQKWADAQVDTWSKTEEPDKLIANESKAAYTARVARFITGVTIVMAASHGAHKMEPQIEVDGLEMLVAAGRYKLDQGTWPRTFKDMTPAYLPRIPMDPYSKKGAAELHYVVGKTGPYLYSVGLNEKDEGGEGDDVVAGFKPKQK